MLSDNTGLLRRKPLFCHIQENAFLGYLLLFRLFCFFGLWANASCQYRELFGTYLPGVGK
jgi:hypothetical protein